jgi:phosphatidylinositol glycan class M
MMMMIPRRTFVGAAVLRLALLCYGEWQDAAMDVKFTDVDYWVFTDAAAAIAAGGSPFDRATYRYTPLLAMALLPNGWLGKAWGKAMFCAADLLAALFIAGILTRRMGVSDRATEILVNAGWLFNPLIFTISARGNAESLLCCLILGTVYFLTEGGLVPAGLLFGLSVHLKLFPAIYAFPFLPFIWHAAWRPHHNPTTTESSPSHAASSTSLAPDEKESVILRAVATPSPLLGASHARKKAPQPKPVSANKKRKAALFGISKKLLRLVLFAVASLASFTLATLPMFYLYGQKYLQESFLYHLHRKDHRHNFSPYFLPFYLESVSPLPPFASLLAFLPQVLLLVLIGIKLGRTHLPFACFLQTFVFVTFNKVCTSQYFLWYLCLFPFAYATLSAIKPAEWIGLAGLWFGAQAVWLKFAYNLEFLGRPHYLHVWLASLLFMLVNTGIAYFMINKLDK